MVYVTKGGKTYHEGWCPYVRRMKKKSVVDEQRAKERGLCECRFCRSTRGLAYRYQKLVLSDMECCYDKIDDAICFKTSKGFWKLIWKEEDNTWRLFHLNHGCFWKDRPAKDMMRRSFHRQTDVPPMTSISKIVNYIREHDRNLEISDGDYRKMPRSTKKQEKYYKKAKKKARRKEIQNVYKILDQINQNGREN